MICEDEIVVAKDLARMLKNLGFAVTDVVVTAEEAILAAENARPDLILMDMDMGGETDGIGAVEQILNHMDVPVVYMTASTERLAFERAKKTEPYGYLRVPVGMLEMGSTIEAVLYKHEADKRIRESEALKAKAEELAGLHSWIWDIETGHLTWSDEAYRAFGIRRGELEPTYEVFLNAIHVDDRDLLQSALEDALSGLSPFDQEFRIVQPSGEERVLLSRGEVQRDEKGLPIRMQGVALDITDRKKAELALRLEREQLLSIFDSINEVISVVDAETYEILYVNKFVKERYGKDLIGSFCYKAIHGLDKPCDYCARDIAAGRMGEPYRWDYHNPTVHKDYLATDRIIKWTDGRDAKFHLGIDVTQFRNAQEALCAREAQLVNAVEMAHLGHWEYDIGKDLFTFNDQFYKLFRTTAEHVGGYTLSSAEYARRFVHPDDIHVVADETRKAVETDDPYFRRELEHRIVYADGEIGYITVRIFIVKDDQGRTVKTYGVNQDITERKRWEELHLQSQRSRAVADLAGGVAHNFNNLLQIIIGNLELALDDLELGNHSEVKKALVKIMESSMFGAETVRRLQNFAGIRAHNPLANKEVFDFSEVVKQALEMTRTWWMIIPEKEGIRVSLETDLQEGCLVRGEKNELFEVVVNLIRNATEALTQGGNIWARTYVKGDQVVFTIRDSGLGISQENIRRVFNPFFTTKARAGSGLGLAISRKTIEGIGGNILVESPAGKGTSFTILLPLAESHPDERGSPIDVHLRGMTILVIDDMEAVLEFLRARLTRSGNVVVTASSGREGLEIFQGNTIDLVICDLEMPGINGWEVGKKIRSICEKRRIPKTPFILLTGRGGQQTQSEKIAESGVDAVVEKPIRIAPIMDVIRHATVRKSSRLSQ